MYVFKSVCMYLKLFSDVLNRDVRFWFPFSKTSVTFIMVSELLKPKINAVFLSWLQYTTFLNCNIIIIYKLYILYILIYIIY